MAGFGALAPAPEDWRDQEALSNLAALNEEKARVEAASRTWGQTALDVAKAPYNLLKGLASPDAAQTAAGVPYTPATNMIWNLGKGLGEAVWSGATLPGDVAQGKVAMTDAEGRSSQPLIHRAFDTASLAGGASFGQMARPAAAAVPEAAAVVRPAAALLSDSQVTGAPLTALERAAKQGYTIDAYKGMNPYHTDSLPVTNWKGDAIDGTGSRVPQEITEGQGGRFYSDSPDVAARFAEPFDGSVFPTKLKMENPVVIDAKGKHAAAIQFESIAKRDGMVDEMNQFASARKFDGDHDGIIVKNTKDEGTIYIPKDGGQIRSRFAEFAPENVGRAGLLLEDASVTGAPIAALEHMKPSGQYTKLLDEVLAAPAINKTKLVDEQGLPIQGPAYSKEARAVLADIEKGPKGAGPMDISLQAHVPEVPQVDLPRYVPPRGVSPRLQEAIESPAVQQGLRESMEAGRGVANWYHTDPIRVEFVKELGPAKGQTEFKRFMDTVAATSPRSDVPTNIRNASYYFQRGADLPDKNPYPYGHVAQKLHRQNVETIGREAGWDPFQNPKPASFAENLRGNLEPVTVDTHAFRNIGMRTGDPRFLETQIQQKIGSGERGPNSMAARFGEIDGDIVRYRPQQLVKEGKLTMEEAQKIPTFWAAQPKANEYAAAERFFKDTGEQVGMRPADAQAAAWAGGGDLTGLGTVGTHTFPELMNERVLFTSRMRGESPQKTLSDFIQGRATLLEDSAATGAPIAALEKASAPYQALLDQPPAPAYKSPDVAEIAAAREAAPAPAAGGHGPGGAGGGDARLLEAAAEAERRAGAEKPLEGLPRKAMKIGDEYFVPGPIAKVREVAADYMANRDTPSYHKPPEKYHPLDEDHSRAVAKAFDEMKHDPDNPAVKASYNALIDETKAQYQAIEKTGLKIEPIEPGMPDPYAANPRLAAKDVADNNHLWYFPTDAGFGSNPGAGIDMAKHPMMRPTGVKLGERELLANDLFRIVHDYFGHLKEGYGFRAAGEDNAWRSHASMYSDLARPAMTTETRGQNSWVNYGPHGDKNRTASAADTTYADQKVGLMPEWTMRDRGSAEPIIAYHGGPHSFDKFDMSKIGGGEGNQAYGHGLYFAEKDAVSEWYRHQLAGRRDPLLKKYGLESQDGAEVGILVANAGGDASAVARGLREYAESLRGEGRRDLATKNMIKRAESKADYLEDASRAKGHMYEVAIDAPPEKFMDWDNPLTDQPPGVQKLFSEFGVPETARRPAGALYEQMSGKVGQKSLSDALKAAGIPGIKYLDQASRSGGKGTRNYVTFDAPRLLRKYAVPGAIGTGSMFGAIGRPEE